MTEYFDPEFGQAIFGQPWNFKYQNIEISWYKWLGRGTSINRKITPEEAIEMFEVCLRSIREDDEDGDL